jgi:hypothetical protein
MPLRVLTRVGWNIYTKNKAVVSFVVHVQSDFWRTLYKVHYYYTKITLLCHMIQCRSYITCNPQGITPKTGYRILFLYVNFY